MIVQVIPPANSGGHRHEERFPDGTTDEQVIAMLTMPYEVVTRDGPKMRPALQDGYGRLAGNIAYLAHPQTVVAVGTVDRELSPNGVFNEERRIRG